MVNNHPVHLRIFSGDGSEFADFPLDRNPNASDYYYKGQQGYPIWTDMVDGTQMTHAYAIIPDGTETEADQ
jgi:hypothetical protein